MFFIFQKEKIFSFILTICLVIALFVVGEKITEKNAVIETAAKNRLIPIYNVNTNENKLSLTINCAWNDDDIDIILDILKNNNIKVTFFMVGEWVDKYQESVKKIADAGHEIRKSF